MKSKNKKGKPEGGGIIGGFIKRKSKNNCQGKSYPFSL